MKGLFKGLRLYVRSMGKTFQVRGMFPDTDTGTNAANLACERNTDLAVMACTDGWIILADKYEGKLLGA